MKTILYALIPLLTLESAGLRAASLDLAIRGRSAEVAIVIPAKPIPSQEYAAFELQKFVREMTDVTLPISRGGGETHCARTIELVVDSAMEDGFRLQAKDGNLVVTGGKRGVLYGVYELLEAYGGCGWFASWVSEIPHLAKFSVPADLDDRQKPVFLLREPLVYDMFVGDFAARNKVNGDFRTAANRPPAPRDGLKARHGGPAYPFDSQLKNCHTFNKLLPPSEFFKGHPEYYSLVNGVRQDIGWQPCLSNPDVLRIVTERVLKRIRENPGVRIFGVSQEDGGKGPCQCPKCKALDDAEGSPSASVIAFVNKVAEAVEKEFPDVIIETLAYQYSTLPPKTIRPRKNVMICLCANGEFSKPLAESRYPESIAFVKALREWRSYANYLYVWDYVLNYKFQHHAFPNIPVIQPNMRLFRDCGVTHVFEQGCYASERTDFAELKAWLLAKLLWNPDQDVDTLIARFCRGFYGAAAPDVITYLKRLHAYPRDEVKYPLKISEDIVVSVVPDDFFDWASDLFARAADKVVADPVRRENVEACRFNADTTRVLRFLRGPDCGYLRTAGGRPANAVRLGEMRRTAGRMVAWMDAHPNIGFSEQANRRLIYEAQIRRLAKDDVSTPLTVEDRLVWMDPTVQKYSAYVNDSAAGDGKAIFISGRYQDWTAHFDLNQVIADSTAEYVIRARVRVEQVEGATGVVFRASLGSLKSPRASLAVDAAQIVDGAYHDYDLFVWKPKKGDVLHFGSGLYSGKAPYRAVYLDRYEIIPKSNAEGTAFVPSAWKSKVRKAAFWAHRGGSVGVIPNTLPAARKTMGAGFGVEIDVFRSNDNRIWCYHDRRGHQKIGIEKWCTNMVWEGEIEKCDYTRGYGERGRGVRPMLLEEVLPLVTDETPIELDLKDPRGEELLVAIRDLLTRFPNVTPNNCYLAGRGDLVRRLMPDFKTVATRNSRVALKPGARPFTEEEILKKVGKDLCMVKGISIRWDPEVVTSSLIKKIHARGTEVWVWGYHGDPWRIDDPKEAAEAFARGVDGVICEDPEALYKNLRGQDPAENSEG